MAANAWVTLRPSPRSAWARASCNAATVRARSLDFTANPVRWPRVDGRLDWTGPRQPRNGRGALGRNSVPSTMQAPPSKERPACPACGYSLAGHPAGSASCPECGQDLDAAALARWRRRQRRVRVSRAVLLLAVVYAPFCAWVFLEDYPWDQYRWHWVKVLPLMPTLLPADLLVRVAGAGGGAHRELVAGVLLLLVGLPLLWFATRSTWRCGIAVAVLLPLMSVMAWVLRGLFLA